MATGAGKTVAAAEIIRRYNRPALFLADAKELVYQAAEKIGAWTGTIPDIETGESHACGSSQIVVGTTQSVSGRLFKYYPEDISLIIVDEAHRNTLGSRALRVLNLLFAREGRRHYGHALPQRQKAARLVLRKGLLRNRAFRAHSAGIPFAHRRKKRSGGRRFEIRPLSQRRLRRRRFGEGPVAAFGKVCEAFEGTRRRQENGCVFAPCGDEQTLLQIMPRHRA